MTRKEKRLTQGHPGTRNGELLQGHVFDELLLEEVVIDGPLLRHRVGCSTRRRLCILGTLLGRYTGFFNLAILGLPSASVLLGELELALGYIPESHLLEVYNMILY